MLYRQWQLPQWGAVLVCALGWAVVAAADPIPNIINQATLGEYQSYLRALTGVDSVPSNPPTYLTNRYVLGPNAQVAGQWIQSQFGSFGLNASSHSFDIPGYGFPFHGQNIIGELPGTTRPDDVYVICAHYDTAITRDLWGNPSLVQPGCDDNGSGTAAVLMAARILSQFQFEGTIRFVAFSAEEEGLVGSEAYAQAAQQAGENIVAAINLDMLLHPGFDDAEPDPDYDLDIIGNGSSQWLAQQLADAYSAYTPLSVQVHNDPGYGSDQYSFWQVGYDAIALSENTAHEIWGGSNDTYHQVTDVLGNADFDWEFGLSAVRGGMAGLIGLAGLVPEPSTFGLLAVVALLATRRSRRGLRTAATASSTPALAGVLVLTALVAPATFAGTLYVDDDAALGGDGQSWPTAYRYLQDALAVALPGDEIRVAAGLYQPDQSETGVVTPGDRTATFLVAFDLSLYGGYRGCPGGDCGNADERDIVAYETVLTGDLQGDDDHTDASRAENSHRVVTIDAVGAAPALDGCTVKGANRLYVAGLCGGLHVNAGSPNVTYCRFMDNRLAAGVYCGAGTELVIADCVLASNECGLHGRDSQVTATRCHVSQNRNNDIPGEAAGVGLTGQGQLVDCVISGNVSETGGGGAGGLAIDGQFTVTGCVVTGNIGGHGGIAAQGTVSITDCVIRWNQALETGGGINAWGTVALARCTISDNWSVYTDGWELGPGSGGGLYYVGGFPAGILTVSECRFSGNVAGSTGGAVAFPLWNDPVTAIFSDCIFAGNAAGSWGGAMDCPIGGPQTPSPTFTCRRCTFSGNTAGEWGGAIHAAAMDAPITVEDSIFCGNSSSQAAALFLETGYGQTLTISNCAVVGNTGTPNALWTMADEAGSIRVTGCTIARTRSRWQTGLATIGGDGHPLVANSILWANIGEEISGECDVEFSDVESGYAGAGNIAADPQFAASVTGAWTQAGTYDYDEHRVAFTDANAGWTADELVGKYLIADTAANLPQHFVIIANTATTVTAWADWETINSGELGIAAGRPYEIYDVRLTAASPCVNAGSNYVAGLPATDLAGAPRIQQCRVDMGAYESAFAGPFVDCNNNGVSDDCDIYDGTSADANQNHIPDECETPPGCAGDLNGDGTLDFADINAFVLYLSNFPAWQATYPACDPRNGDLNGDGEYGPGVFSDINAFVTRLTQCGSGCRCE